jgi:hypothetical protein
MAPAGKSAADEKSRSLTPAGVHAYSADFAIIAGRAEPRECNLRGDAQSESLSRCTYRCLLRSHCARVGGAPRDRTPYLHSDGRLSSRACITTGGEVVGATLLSGFSRVCERDRPLLCFRKFSRRSTIERIHPAIAASSEKSIWPLYRRAIGHRK